MVHRKIETCGCENVLQMHYLLIYPFLSLLRTMISVIARRAIFRLKIARIKYHFSSEDRFSLQRRSKKSVIQEF